MADDNAVDAITNLEQSLHLLSEDEFRQRLLQESVSTLDQLYKSISHKTELVEASLEQGEWDGITPDELATLTKQKEDLHSKFSVLLQVLWVVKPLPPSRPQYSSTLESTELASREETYFAKFEMWVHTLAPNVLKKTNIEHRTELAELAEAQTRTSDSEKLKELEYKGHLREREISILREWYRKLVPPEQFSADRSMDATPIVTPPDPPAESPRPLQRRLPPLLPIGPVFMADQTSALSVTMEEQYFAEFAKSIHDCSPYQLRDLHTKRREALAGLRDRTNQVRDESTARIRANGTRIYQQEISLIEKRYNELLPTRQLPSDRPIPVEPPTPSIAENPASSPAERNVQVPNSIPTHQLGSIVLGTDIATQQPVTLEGESKDLGIYIIGMSGVGKSTLMQNMILQDIDLGNGVCVLDPHGDLIDSILKTTDADPNQIILLDPDDWQHPFGLNLFECSNLRDPTARARAASYVMGIFEKLWGNDGLSPSWGAQLEDILRHISQTFVHAQQYTLVDVPSFLLDGEFRELVLQSVNPQVRTYWEQSYNPIRDKRHHTQSTVNKIHPFIDHEILHPILGQSQSTINFGTSMDSGKIILVSLPEGKIGKEAVTLLGSLIIGQILQATLARVESPPEQRRPFSLYCDEYYYFATTDFPRFFTEGRKFKVSTIIAHQGRYQLDNLSKQATLNVVNKVAFRVSGKDAQELSHEFHYTPPQPFRIVAKDPLKALLHHEHVNNIVNEFVERIRVFSQLADEMENAINARERASEFKRRAYHPGMDHIYHRLKAEYEASEAKQDDLYGGWIFDRSECLIMVEDLRESNIYINQYIHKLMSKEITISATESCDYARLILELLRRHLGLTGPRLSSSWTNLTRFRPSHIRLNEEERQSVHSIVAYQKVIRPVLTQIITDTINSSSNNLSQQWQHLAELPHIHEYEIYTPKLDVRKDMRTFLELMIAAMRILAETPIYETGVLGEVDSSQETIVSLLSSLDKYSARASIQIDDSICEVTMQTEPPREVIQTGKYENAIVTNSRAHYTRPLQTIMTQIQTRQKPPKQLPPEDQSGELSNENSMGTARGHSGRLSAQDSIDEE